MKYVVLKAMGREVPILFPNSLVHKEVADAIISGCTSFSRAQIVSAGEFSSMDIEAECHGKSETCRVKSRGEVDSQLINGHDYFHGL